MTTELLPFAGPRAASRAMRDELEPPAVDDSLRRLLAAWHDRIGLAPVCVDVATGDVVAAATRGTVLLLPLEVRRRLAGVRRVATFEHESGLLFGAWAMPSARNRPLVGVAVARARPTLARADLALMAAAHDWGQQQLDAWLAGLPLCAPDLLQSLLELAARDVEHDGVVAGLHDELDALGLQIERTFEEITLLHNVTRNLQISRRPGDLAELCLEQLHALTPADGTLIWIEEKRGSGRLLTAGEAPLDELGLARLLARFDAWDWSRPLVRNHVAATPLAAEFPGLRGFVATPIADGAYRAGWILAVNQPPGMEFGTVEASLLNSVASILGTHVRNIDLYEQHEELLLSFVRSLVSTLDAKDPYTRGHSERVALVARRLAVEAGLTYAEQQDVYLAGLLHDIGKIGVDDRILQKPGQLTDEEFREIQKHPMIGYNILQGLTNLQKVLPGVRNHHESWNGKGYPDGLSGEEIPLMARLLAVADSYDAMSSDRPYRKGMPLEKLEEIFRRGAGEQWDAQIIEAYFRCRTTIRDLCASYSPSRGCLLPTA